MSLSLSAPVISARQPERQLQELLNEFYRGYFNGQPHTSPLGDVTFDNCALMFNQSDIPSPQDKPQIHTVFTGWDTEECWWVGGNLSTWSQVLANPASGVTYGLTTGKSVEESVNGKSARILPGLNIRWQTDSGSFVEQVFDGATWNTTRAFPAGTSALRWIRDSSLNYVEQANVSGAWTNIRTIGIHDPVWDGTKILVTATVELSHFCRAVVTGGDLQKSDFISRRIASNLNELLDNDQARAPLSQKGIRSLQHRSGPRPIPTQGYATRVLIYKAILHYYVPKEGQ